MQNGKLIGDFYELMAQLVDEHAADVRPLVVIRAMVNVAQVLEAHAMNEVPAPDSLGAYRERIQDPELSPAAVLSGLLRVIRDSCQAPGTADLWPMVMPTIELSCTLVELLAADLSPIECLRLGTEAGNLRRELDRARN